MEVEGRSDVGDGHELVCPRGRRRGREGGVVSATRTTCPADVRWIAGRGTVLRPSLLSDTAYFEVGDCFSYLRWDGGTLGAWGSLRTDCRMY